MATQDEFRAEVEAFLERHDIAPATLGSKALKDPKFVSDLRKGRAPSTKTIDKVRQWMRDFEAGEESAGPSGDAGEGKDETGGAPSPPETPASPGPPAAGKGKQRRSKRPASAKSAKAAKKAESPVSDATLKQAAEAAASGESAPRRRGGRALLVIVIILLMFLIGWSAGPYLTQTLRTALPSDLAERIGLAGGPAADYGAAIGDLEEKLERQGQRNAELERRLENMGERIARIEGATLDPGRLADLEARLARMEQVSEELSAVDFALRLQDLRDSVGALQNRLSAQDDRLQTLSQEIDRLGRLGPGRERALALLIGYQDLRRSIEAASAYGDDLRRMRRLSGEEGAVIEEERFATALAQLDTLQSAPQTERARLIREFETAAIDGLREARLAEKQSWLGKTWAQLMPITVRRTDSPEGDGLAGAVAAADSHLGEGRLREAAAALGAYGGDMPQALADWLKKAQAHLARRAALAAIEQSILAAFESSPRRPVPASDSGVSPGDGSRSEPQSAPEPASDSDSASIPDASRAPAAGASESPGPESGAGETDGPPAGAADDGDGE